MRDSDSPPLDPEDWNIVFQAYAEYPILAFILAQHFDTVKTLILQGSEGREEALAGLNRAIDSLMRHTHFRDAGRTVYLRAVRGSLSPKDEETIRELGLIQ
jgi:hypothetical protein